MTRPTTTRESTIVRAILKAFSEVPGLVARKRWGTALGKAGDPDLYGSFRGKHFELEVKRPGEELTPLQWARLAEWQEGGATVGVVHNKTEALDALGIRRP